MMKKKKVLIGITCVVVVMIIMIAGAAFVLKNSLGFSVGTCIAADNGGFLIVLNNSPIAMHPRSGGSDIFSNLTTGDEIFVIHDGIAETYPGQTGVYMCIKLEEGDGTDIPEDILNSLRELGWISE